VQNTIIIIDDYLSKHKTLVAYQIE